LVKLDRMTIDDSLHFLAPDDDQARRRWLAAVQRLRWRRPSAAHPGMPIAAPGNDPTIDTVGNVTPTPAAQAPVAAIIG
jgi:hypothetical protein